MLLLQHPVHLDDNKMSIFKIRIVYFKKVEGVAETVDLVITERMTMGELAGGTSEKASSQITR